MLPEVTPAGVIHSGVFYIGKRELNSAALYSIRVVRESYHNGNLIHSVELPARRDLRNHSPDGFEWGYSGSGPAQLALALIADATEDDPFAEENYQDFKARIVAGFSRDGWMLSREAIRKICKYQGEGP